MNAHIIPFPAPRHPAAKTPASRHMPIRQVSIDGEFAEDDMTPELFDPEGDFEDLAHELGLYVKTIDGWPDRWPDR